jgi:hypothetical protein
VIAAPAFPEFPELVSIILHCSVDPDPEQFAALAATWAEPLAEARVEVVLIPKVLVGP